MKKLRQKLAILLAIVLMMPVQPVIAAEPLVSQEQEEAIADVADTMEEVDASLEEASDSEDDADEEEDASEGEVSGQDEVPEEDSDPGKEETSDEVTDSDAVDESEKENETSADIDSENTETSGNPADSEDPEESGDETVSGEAVTYEENVSVKGAEDEEAEDDSNAADEEEILSDEEEELPDEEELLNDLELATPSEAELSDTPEDMVIFNTGSCEFQVVSYEDFWENELGDTYFEEDGSYTIQIPDANPFFPYEVQFTYDGEVTNEWFMDPEDSVVIGGHDFYVSAYFDGTVVTQINMEIAGDIVAVYPEEKEFTNGDGLAMMSLLPLETKYLTLDLTAYTPIELTMVSVDSIFTGDNELADTDHVIWTINGDDDYTISTSGSILDLSYSTWYGGTTWEMITGEVDQLAASNVKYKVTIDTVETETWLVPSIQKLDEEGNRSDVTVIDYDYYDSYNSSESGYRELYIDIPTSETEDKPDLYIGLDVDSSLFESGLPYDYLKVYEGEYTSAEEAADGTDITDLILSGDYVIAYNYRQYVTIVGYDSDGNVTGCLPVYIYIGRTSGGISSGLYKVTGTSSTYVVNSSSTTTDSDSGISYKTYTLYSGYPADDIYYLQMDYYDIYGSIDNNRVTGAYIGIWSSLAEAVPGSSEADIKEDLFGSTGYAADYSGGVYFTVFIGEDDSDNQEIYQYCITTIEGTTVKSSGVSLKIYGVMDADGNRVVCYVVDEEEDSYAEYNYLTILVEDGTDLTNLAPLFYDSKDSHVYVPGSSTPEVSGESYHDFSNGAVEYTVAAENGSNSKNYWIQILKPEDGEGQIYINSLVDEDAETSTEDGIVTSTREVMLDGLHDYVHDILLVNYGMESINAISAEIDSEQVELDEYWTLKGVYDLSGFYGYGSSGYKMQDMWNLAKIRIRAKDGVANGSDISGTLTIKSGGTTLMVLNLTGTVGDPSIVTDEIPDAVKYVPYGTMIQNSNKYYSNNTVSYSLTSGTLPGGMEMRENGELYGVPTETGEFTFTIRLRNSNSSFGSSSKTFTLTVIENTDANVEAATDIGYELTERIPDMPITSKTDYTMVSQGIYPEFTYIFLDGEKLVEGEDYDSESGSTRITIRSQTLTDPGVGTHTLGIEFRTQDDNNTLYRAAQNYRVTRSSGSSGSSDSDSDSGSSGSSDNSGTSSLISDPKKGYMSTIAGIITGSGSGYSHWEQDDNGWKLIYADGTTAGGYMAEQPDGSVVEQVIWEQINGSRYAFGANGYLKSGWLYDYQQNSWYCMSVDSGMRTGWYVDPQDRCTYYLDDTTGQIVSGWRIIDGKWYYFNAVSVMPTWLFDESTGNWYYDVSSKNKPFGALYLNERTPDGYLVDQEGVWDENEE